MDPSSWERPWGPFRELQREVDRWFEALGPRQSARWASAYPPLNLYDEGNRYVVLVQLPGALPGEIDVTITGDSLVLRGERKRADGAREESFRRQERPMGRWSRSITLSDRVDGALVTASFSQGMLTIVVPKAESSKPRQILVTSGDEAGRSAAGGPGALKEPTE